MPPAPILDRVQPLPAAKRRAGLGLYLGMVIGAAVGLTLPRIINTVASRPVFLVTLFAAFYLVILVHECGHLCAALLARFEFREIAVGPLMLSRRSTGPRVRFVPGLMFAGGHVVAVPDSPHDLRRRFRILVSGGPVATALVFGALALLPLTPMTWSLWLWNTIVAVSSWLPFYTGGNASDGKALLLLSRAGREGDWLAAILYIVAVDRQGAWPRDWPVDVVEQLASDGASPPAATARYLAMVHALDTGDRERIAAALEEVLSASHKLRPDLRRVCFSEAAFYQGVYARDATLARGWLEDARQVKGATSESGWEEGLLAAISYAEGHESEAGEHARAAIAYLDRWPAESGSVAAARRRLGDLTSLPSA
jgi:hypothetical protein